MRLLTFLLAFILGFSPATVLSLSQDCISALKTLFEKEVTKDEAGEFLHLQGDITLHRMAYAYLKRQKKDDTEKLESVKETLIELLNEKYTNADPNFIAAREAYESQPLSRSTLADIAPYLKEALSHEYGEDEARFKLNASDIKLLSAVAKFEKKSAVNGKYDHRMLGNESPLGMLNFVKLINSGYKLETNSQEKDLQIEMKLSGLENVMGNMQKKLSDFLDKMETPEVCKSEEECKPDDSLSHLFNTNEEVENIFWESLADKLESDDVLLERLSYGDLWLKVKGQVASTPSQPSGSSTGRSHVSPKQETAPETKDTHHTANKPKPYSPRVPKPTKILAPTSPTIIQNAGLIIQDPIGVIVRDKPGRQRSSYESFDKGYLEDMANAVVEDDKVFLHKGHLFDRHTGKAVSIENALLSLPPKQRAEALNVIKSAPAEIQPALTAALANGKQSFIANGKLYDRLGKRLDPAAAIAESMSKKTGIIVSPDRYKGMQPEYLISRANALKNNQPYFRLGNKTYDSWTGKDLASPFRQPGGHDSKIDKNKRRMYEHLSDGEIIVNFHREHPNKDCGYYGIVDKRNAMFKIYSNAGAQVYSSEVLIGAEKSDMRTRWTTYSPTQRTPSASTGAGIFTVRPQDMGDTFNQKHFKNNILSFNDESNKGTVFAIHQVPVGLEARYTKFGTNNPDDRRISGGCANLKLSDFQAMKKYLGPKCQVFVLPEEEGNKFIVQDDQLKFVPAKPVALNKTNLYNFSSGDNKPKPIDIKIVNKEADTQQSREFTLALENEKAKLMKMYQLSNDEYNDLAMLAFGIMGNESSFGQSKKLMVKENAQWLVIAMRALRGDGEQSFNTSRGLTQIKYLPGPPFSSQYPEVNKDNLTNPRNSAVATIGYLAEAAKTMRQIAIQNQSDPSKLRITRENMMDFMGYLYQGGKSKLTTGDKSHQATPEFNAYYRSLQRNMSYIEVTQGN